MSKQDDEVAFVFRGERSHQVYLDEIKAHPAEFESVEIESSCEPAGVGGNERRWHAQLQLDFDEKVMEVSQKLAESETNEKIDLNLQAALLSRLMQGPHTRDSVVVAEVVDAPPRVARFLLLLIPKQNREGIFGDLEEEFQTILVPEYGVCLAQLYYWWHAMLSLASQVLGAVEKVSRAFSRK